MKVGRPHKPYRASDQHYIDGLAKLKDRRSLKHRTAYITPINDSKKRDGK